MNIRLAGMALAAALSGCASMPDTLVEGLPPLLLTEHQVKPEQILKHCSKAMGWWHWVMLTPPVACATINFQQRTCDIYVTADATPATLEHERLHCQGYDHGGRLRTAFNSWLRANAQQMTLRSQPAIP